VQCPLQASPITQPPVRYIHTTVAHRCTQFRIVFYSITVSCCPRAQ